MNFIEYTSNWAKNEVLQGKIMIGVGLVLSTIFLSMLSSENQFLKGTLIPLGLILAILLGYGSYILYSRPKHANEAIRLYQKSPNEAIKQETTKHINDNKAGNLLIKIYPFLMLVLVLVIIFFSSTYYKGMALGFLLLFVAAYIIDNGFVSRSNAFISFLNNIQKH